MAINGYRAIEAATFAIGPDGDVVSVKPPDAPVGAQLTSAVAASGAAFFMADACPALIALGTSPDAGEVADAARREQVIAALDCGLRWLITQSDDRERVDRRAPNRLLYDALAYQGCGVLAENTDTRILSGQFVALALSQSRRDGVFVEDGGSDTTYQAVAVRLALDLLLTGYRQLDAQHLHIAWQSGAVWLGHRIMTDGRIGSTGNTRTCPGGESVLGTQQKVSPPVVYGALIYAAELGSGPDMKAAAARLSEWATANPRTDPCFP